MSLLESSHVWCLPKRPWPTPITQNNTSFPGYAGMLYDRCKSAAWCVWFNFRVCKNSQLSTAKSSSAFPPFAFRFLYMGLEGSIIASGEIRFMVPDSRVERTYIILALFIGMTGESGDPSLYYKALLFYVRGCICVCNMH